MLSYVNEFDAAKYVTKRYVTNRSHVSSTLPNYFLHLGEIDVPALTFK